MGFELERQTAVFVFEKYPGLEAELVFDPPISMYSRFTRLALMQEQNDPQKVVEAVEDFEDYLDAFGREVLLRWNLTRDGQPVPVSEFSNQPMAFCMDIIGEWYRRSGTVPAPLVPASSNGNRSAEKLGRTVRSSPSRRK